MPHGDPSGFRRVRKLPMASLGGHVHPSVLLEHPDESATVAFHDLSLLCINIHKAAARSTALTFPQHPGQSTKVQQKATPCNTVTMFPDDHDVDTTRAVSDERQVLPHLWYQGTVGRRHGFVAQDDGRGHVGRKPTPAGIVARPATRPNRSATTAANSAKLITSPGGPRPPPPRTRETFALDAHPHLASLVHS